MEAQVPADKSVPPLTKQLIEKVRLEKQQLLKEVGMNAKEAAELAVKLFKGLLSSWDLPEEDKQHIKGRLLDLNQKLTHILKRG